MNLTSKLIPTQARELSLRRAAEVGMHNATISDEFGILCDAGLTIETFIEWNGVTLEWIVEQLQTKTVNANQ